MDERFELTGLRGDNPLCFLAALGTLVTLEDAGIRPKLLWEEDLVPTVLISEAIGKAGNAFSEGEKRDWLISTLYKQLTLYTQLKKEGKRAPKTEQDPADPVLLKDEKNVKFNYKKYERFVLEAKSDFLKKGRYHDRRWLDMAAFYGVTGPQGEPAHEEISANYWVLLEGSGHQNFFSTIRGLISNVKETHLKEALFGPWEPVDEKLSLRLDPLEDRRYALMYENPSDLKTVTLWGANRLAFEAFRLFAAVPSVHNGMGVLGWREQEGGQQVRWPLWKYPANTDVVRSLLAHPAVWSNKWDDWISLQGLGVFAVLEAKRVKIDRYKNMTMGTPLWMEL